MKKHNVMVAWCILSVSALLFSGCSRTENRTDNGIVAGAEQAENTDKCFGKTKLIRLDNNESASNNIYLDEDGNTYYYDKTTDNIRMIICNTNANTVLKSTSDEIEEKAKEILANVSSVYLNKDVKLNVVSEAGGYATYCYSDNNENLYMAIIYFDGEGKMLTANFNPEAYDKNADEKKYSDDIYVERAKKILSDEIGEKYNGFITDKTEITISDNIIAGTYYKIIRFVNNNGIYEEGYEVEINSDDLSLKMIDTLK